MNPATGQFLGSQSVWSINCIAIAIVPPNKAVLEENEVPPANTNYHFSVEDMLLIDLPCLLGFSTCIM